MVAAAILCACGKSPTDVEDRAPITRVVVTPTSITLVVGASAVLSAVVKDSAGAAVDTTVTWSVDDPAIAMVSSDGVVTAVGVGTATVTARADTASATASVTVTSNEGLTLQVSPGSLEFFLPETRQLAAIVRDAGGYVVVSAVTWTSSDPTVVEVDGSGNLTGVAPGSASIVAAAGTLADTAAVTVLATLGFQFPLVGEVNRDFYYVNYVDQTPGTGISDYQCALKTYDGHLGTDVTLPSFAVMDSGVTVVAGAPGTVSFVHDGEFDRRKSNGAGGFGNHVIIEHENGFRTIYGHLATMSIVVAQGQHVTAGTVLGRVGSSGNSDMPHLHIELQRNTVVVDGFAGPCGALFAHWAAPHPYQDGFALIQSGVSNQSMTLDLVKDPPAPVDTMTTADAQATWWVHLFNAAQGAVSRFDLYTPSGALHASFSTTHGQFYSMSWWWAFYTIPGFITELGTWRLEYYYNGQKLGEQAFELVAAPAGARVVSGDSATRGGIAGGGLRSGVEY